MASMLNLKQGSHIHLMGICGTAMASLAGLLKDRGYKVTGSDINPYPPMSTQVENLGISIMKGYRAQNLHPTPDFVIVGNVISANNPEAQELVRLKIPYTSLAQAMGEMIIADNESIVIAGTHGKTTSTSLMAWVCDQCGYPPGFLIGGIPKNFSLSFRNPISQNQKRQFFVIEGDEYDTAYFDKVPKFIHYKPRHVILTSIEFDHADIYKDLDDVKKAFVKLLQLIPKDGTLIYHAEDKNILDILKNTSCQNTYSYGMKTGDFQAQIIFQNDQQTTFDVYFQKEKIGSFLTSMTGEYNILNATAVIAMGYLNQFDKNLLVQSIASFQGVKRRQEIIGEPHGILLIEDFAHHPTAVRETIKGIQKKYSPRKVFSVFEPRSATSRRKIFQKDYVEAFSEAHESIIAQAYDQNKINEENRFSSTELVAELCQKGRSASCFNSADEIVHYLKKTAHRGDVVLIMSNGGFDGIYQKLLNTL